jgi:hypothetical protein
MVSFIFVFSLCMRWWNGGGWNIDAGLTLAAASVLYAGHWRAEHMVSCRGWWFGAHEDAGDVV